MREIDCGQISAVVSRLCIEANRTLPVDVAARIREAREQESRELPKAVLEQMEANQRVAAETGLPLCQDTGLAVVFLRLGQEVHICGGLLADAVNAGVADGYEKGYLRKSMVTALSRENTKDNTPAVLHLELVAGDKLAIMVMPKGGGAENMSALAMLKPSQGLAGIREFVVQTVKKAGSNPCPPIVVGIGIGGNFEVAPLLAKQALAREIGSVNPDAELAELEGSLLRDINALGIGVQGFGGGYTALAVFAASRPCHFATLPVAVNINCHVARHATAVL